MSPDAVLMNDMRIERGTPGDYEALAHFHYLGGAPARPTRILRGVARGSLVGVLVISMPTLNSTVRELAWPGRYRTGDKRVDARRLNRELRTITRVIVDARWRGLGIARRLVRAYLDEPSSEATEAIASMGRLNPFFERAGMTMYRLPLSVRDARLLDALSHAGVDHRRLVDVDEAVRIGRDPFVESELRLWANGSRSTRALLKEPTERIATAAGVRLGARPVGYAAVRGE